MPTMRRAIWSGTCYACGGGIERGTQILSEKSEGFHRIRHMNCDERRSPAPPKGGGKTGAARASEAPRNFDILGSATLTSMLEKLTPEAARFVLAFLDRHGNHDQFRPEQLDQLRSLAAT